MPFYPQPAGGASGGAVTIADGADVAEGARADAAWTGVGSGSVVSILKACWVALTGTLSVQDQTAETSLATIAAAAAETNTHLGAIRSASNELAWTEILRREKELL